MDRMTSAGTTAVGPLMLVALHSPVTGMSRTASVNRLIADDALVLRRYTKNWRAPDDRKVNPWDLTAAGVGVGWKYVRLPIAPFHHVPVAGNELQCRDGHLLFFRRIQQ
jgi:hypothetical protein